MLEVDFTLLNGSATVVEEISLGEGAPSVSNLDFEDLPIGHPLGTQWSMEADMLSFRVKRNKFLTPRGESCG